MIYNVTLHKKDYPAIPYSLDIMADTEESAKEAAKQTIAEKAYWENDTVLTMADKLNTLIIDEIIQRTKDAIEKYKKENDGKYDTDSIIDAACEHLESEGYMCDYISEDATIEF